MAIAPEVPDPVAGAAVLYPAREPGSPVLHLARTEARKGRPPAMFGVCPLTHATALERAPKRWRPGRWCPQCKAYRDYLRSQGEV